MAILGFAHASIVVPDIEKALEFYTKMFGLKPTAREDWERGNEFFDHVAGLEGTSARGYILKTHNCYLELYQYLSPEQTGPEPGDLGAHELGIRHLAFYVDDIFAEYNRLKELGGVQINPPAGDTEQGFVTFCRDPFGNIIELSTVGGPSRPLTELDGVRSNGSYTPGD
jgi:catechol 2,3-dioxygenase-like lactoylglutathione lyase family enzyme